MLVCLAVCVRVAADGDVECMDVMEELAAALGASNSSSGSGSGGSSSRLLASALGGRPQFTSAAECKYSRVDERVYSRVS